MGAPPIKATGPGGGKPAQSVPSSTLNPLRLGKALGRVQPEGRAVTRGAKEVRVYQAAAPSVVLIVSDESFGSGAVIGADGLIVTNLHVVGEDDVVGVVFKPAQGTDVTPDDVVRAEVIRRDALTDLALLRVDEVPAGLRPLALGSVAGVSVGEDVHAIGHPTGESWTYTRGIVSQVRPGYDWTIDRQKYKATVIQTQTPINPGNSGGPLLDDNLNLVGINSFTGEGEGMNYAVSVDDVRALLAMKSDRPDRSGKKQAAAKRCEPEVVATERSDDPKGLWSEVDMDCDGKADIQFLEPEDKKNEPSVAVYDEDGDGKLDTVLYDFDHDGDWDEGLYDTDGDKQPDLKGYYRKGEEEPYRYEKYTPAKG